MSPNPHVIHCSVGMRWGDMDAYGHINNVEIVRMLEEARVHAFGPPGGTGGSGQQPAVPLFTDVPPGTQSLVVEHRVRYVAELTYRNIPADVDVWISAVKGASLTLAYVIHDPVTGQDCVRAETTLAFVDGATGALQRLTAAQREMAAAHTGTSVFA
ncbi:acyl-CoA thioesterase [Arthrobacter sp. zg-Y769]|uniref:acyl-CoA thioesterase n=1 Tax=Arthrobacter sp. zg-Y769 TaxID=2894191 RepID=UPI001E345410|nr:thioesterase family protein [Arthrobacter sp. zg-Y769]MCC9205248.1 thioesterase family protein [Arthrobacter sp. zg-Y769]